MGAGVFKSTPAFLRSTTELSDPPALSISMYLTAFCGSDSMRLANERALESPVA